MVVERGALGLLVDAATVEQARRQTLARPPDGSGVLLTDDESAAFSRHQHAVEVLEHEVGGAAIDSPLVAFRVGQDILEPAGVVLIDPAAGPARAEELRAALSQAAGIDLGLEWSKLTRQQVAVLDRALEALDAQQPPAHPFESLDQAFGVRVLGLTYDHERQGLVLHADLARAPADPQGLAAAVWPTLVRGAPELARFPELPVTLEAGSPPVTAAR